MWHIELVKNKYESLEDLYSLLQYVFRLNKTADDSRRANIITDDLTGCLPAMIPDINNPDMVYRLMLFIIQRRHKDTPQLVRHRIVSFQASDCIAVIYNAGSIVLPPEVVFNPADGTAFSDETLTVTATPLNAVSAWIQVNDGAKQDFTADKQFTVGADVAYGKNVTITWGATDKEGKTETGSVTYKKVKAYVPELGKADEISCFLETSNAAAAVYVWNNKVSPVIKYAGDWNDAINKKLPLVGKSVSGKNVFKWTYDGTETSAPTQIIFLDGNGNKITADVEFVNHGYYVDGAYSTTVTKVHEDETVDPEYVYFDNASKWENVYCYFYNGTTSSAAWPGVKMTYDASASHNGKTGWYKVQIPTAYLKAKFFINDGTAGTPINGKNASTEQVVK